MPRPAQPLKKLTEADLERRRAALEKDAAQLSKQNTAARTRHATRAADAKSAHERSEQESAATVGGCFVERSEDAAAPDERALKRVFLDEARRRGSKTTVAAPGLRSVLAQCTGAVPTRPEVGAMMAGRERVCLEGFLDIYRDVRAGSLRFGALAETMAAFEALCADLPDAAG